MVRHSPDLAASSSRYPPEQHGKLSLFHHANNTTDVLEREETQPHCAALDPSPTKAFSSKDDTFL